MRTKAIWAAPLVIGLVACAATAGNPEAYPGGFADTDASDKRGDGNGSTNGGGPGGGSGADAGTSAATPTTSDIVLVHASHNLPAFRVCFDGFTQILPMPDDKVMPNANVVGVDVSAAVHIGTLGVTPSGTGTVDASVLDAAAPEASAIDASPQSGQLYVIEEKLVRGFYPQGTDAEAGPNCGALINVLQSNGYEGHGLYTLKGDAVNPGNFGTQLIVVHGCVPDAALSTTECGAGFTTAGGNLKYDVVTTTASAPGAPSATLVFNSAGMASPALTMPADGTLSMATSFVVPTSDADYDTANVTINLGATQVVQTLAEVQAISSPRDLPAHFFGLSTSFVFFVVGDPKIDATTSPTQALHVLAVPVIDPSTLAAANDQ
jgi:hypothetical protein